MISSMTGFANATYNNDLGTISIDIRSVNSRFLEIYIKANENFTPFDLLIRNYIKEKISRGKIEISIAFKPNDINNSLSVNTELANFLLDQALSLSNRAKEQNGNIAINAIDILNFPNVICSEKLKSEALEEMLIHTLEIAVNKFIESRKFEGDKLKNFILKHMENISFHQKAILEQVPNIIEWQREKIKTFAQNAEVKIDNNILEQEIIIFAQRIDVAEELNRLTAHIEQTKSVINKGGVCGKKLDFMMQEFNRETNTIASKSINTEITSHAVELKVLIEQLREQVQNIE